MSKLVGCYVLDFEVVVQERGGDSPELRLRNPARSNRQVWTCRLITEQRNAEEEELKIFYNSADTEDALDTEELDYQYDVDTESTFPVKRTTSMKDPVLRQLHHYVKHGWPPCVKKIVPELNNYARNIPTFSIVKGKVRYCDRVIVPATLRSRVLKQLHTSHQGMVRMKATARRFVYWIGINKDIEDFCRSCPNC
ncbi:hypothetical protein QR680_013113 [Steinernema hermaphroditum]|uniref:RNA-directed DNA polymerase n=1 Tax=Steinernema hermaphroditum TaxID=289476 RepID=A0AA39M1Y3_9BILA|nr:hypothetical protein QR680_013113 [Steinernema hermaphroditum]